ncbi:MAG: putative DNA-binding domain-containing protein [Myxococcota bacterium]
MEAAQRWFTASMYDEGVAGEADRWLVSQGALTGRARLEIYRRMFVVRQLEALQEAFPKTAAALSSKFPSVCRAFIGACPSESPLLELRGKKLPEFLESSGCGEVADLARLEQARTEAFLAPNPVSLLMTSEIDAESFPRCRAQFIPALFLLELSCGTCGRWQAPNQGVPWRALRGDVKTVVVWRREHQVLHATVQGAFVVALARALAGLTMGEVFEAFAAEPDPQAAAVAAFAAWLKEGWVERLAV